jgi:hypothetical protein
VNFTFAGARRQVQQLGGGQLEGGMGGTLVVWPQKGKVRKIPS